MNASIRYISDMAQHGVSDLWVGCPGDVLTKAAELAEAVVEENADLLGRK